MPCYYPQAFLALCNAYSFDENDPQTHRLFLENLLFWMHENYGNALSIYNTEHRFNVPEPSATYQKEIYNWFISIKEIFEFSNMHRVTEWFYDVLDENEIDLAFNMLEVKDQKLFIKYYKSAVVAQEEEINLLDITNDSIIINYINQDVEHGYPNRDDMSFADLEEDIPTDDEMPPLVDADTDEDTNDDTNDDTDDELHTNVTVRNVNRTIDFDDLFNGLAEEVATERENNQTQLYDDDVPDSVSDSDYSSDDSCDDSCDDDSCDDDSCDDDVILQRNRSSLIINV